MASRLKSGRRTGCTHLLVHDHRLRVGEGREPLREARHPDDTEDSEKEKRERNSKYSQQSVVVCLLVRIMMNRS